MEKYPSVVIKKKETSPEGVVFIDEENLVDVYEGSPYMTERRQGNLGGHAYYLDSTVDWVIVKDNRDIVVLVPVKKRK